MYNPTLIPGLLFPFFKPEKHLHKISHHRQQFYKSIFCPVTLVISYILILSIPTSAFSSPLDWFSSKQTTQKRGNTLYQKSFAVKQNPTSILSSDSSQQQSSDLPDFFTTNTATPDLSGANLNPIKFAETHWLNAKGNFEKATKAIQAGFQEKKCQDLVAKLFIVDTQTYKEVLKNSAIGLQNLNKGVQTLSTLLIELNRIITAPREETLETLERTLARIKNQNDALLTQVRALVAGIEQMLTLSQESYQTLELIPSLSLPAIDYFVQASKQVMKLSQSSSEAQKGLLFNIQTAADQITNTLETMVSTVRTTLRFSDHFAFRQFPLINLPVPTREKLFNQLNTLKNSTKGIQNTLSIGDSHLKNSAQQFTHLSQTTWDKIADALKYKGQSEYGIENLPQIAGYSYNQVCGLYQRVKEGINQMKVIMAKESRTPTKNKNAPEVSIETEEEFIARKAKVANGKLPLFLLGESSDKSSKHDKLPTDIASKPAPKGEITILYSERESPGVVKEQLLPDEVDILQEELGMLIPGEDSNEITKKSQSEKENIPKLISQNKMKTLPRPKKSMDLIPATSNQSLPDESSNSEFSEDVISQAAIPTEESDVRGSEVLRLESASNFGENNDVIPMFRLEDFTPPPEKE